MRQLLTATIAVCSLAVCLSCDTNARSRSEAQIATDRESLSVRAPRGSVVAQREPTAEEGRRFVPGGLVVKFRDTLSEPADILLQHRLRFAAHARSGGADLDRLHAEYKVSSARPVFSSLFAGAISMPGKGALMDRRRKVLEQVNASKARFAARSARAGARERAEIPDLAHVYVLDVPADTDLEKMARDFAANPNVESAVPDQLASTQALPDDPYLASSGSWGQPYGDLWPLAKIGAPAAWDVATGLGTVVAVVDTGVDYNHPDLGANVWTNAAELNGLAGVDDDGNGFVDDVRGWDFAYGDADPMDRFGHGTHVAGTIAAVGNNGIGVIGVAYQARIMPVKGLDDSGYGAISTLAAAITYAAKNGADVINNSWGCSGCTTDPALVDAVKLARDLGCVTTFAAGNNGADVKGFFPANLQDVITVAASGADDSRSSFSNWGYLVDVSAPGGGPDDASPYAAYRNILSLRAANTGDPNLIVGGNYLRQAGTSMATPHVSGVAALLLSANPQLTVAEVESILRHTARDGVGAPSLDTPGYDPYFGWGRLDAAAAVARAFDPPADPPILKVVADELEFDLPAGMCAGQQWSLPLSVYNLGGGALSWSSVAPDWLTVQTSGTTPSFPSVSMNRVQDGTGTLTFDSNAANGSAALPVIAHVASDITISNCSVVLSKAYGQQSWDPQGHLSTQPPATPDGAGGAFYVWTDTRYGSPDLFMQHVDASGNPLWGADGMALTSAWPGAEVRPAIVQDGSGGALIAWVEGANSPYVDDKHIRVQRVSASGQKLWGADGIWACQAPGGQERPAIAADGMGGAIVAWTDYRRGSGSDIYAQQIAADGTVLWQPDGAPVTTAADSQFNVAMASDGSGGAILTWVDRRTSYFAVYAQRMRSGQALWAKDGLLVAPQIALGPNIVADGNGGAIIAWHDFRNFPFTSGTNVLSRSDIYAARLDRTGQSLWPAGGVPLSSGLTTAPSTFVPGWAPDQVAMTSDGRGGALVVWHDARSLASWDVYAQRVDPSGSRLWGTTGAPVTTAGGNQLSPAVAADGEGGAVFAWSDYRPADADVFVQRLGPTGAPLGPSNGVWVEGKPGEQRYPFVVPLTHGKFLVTWDDWNGCGSTAGCSATGIDFVGKVVDFGGGASGYFPLFVSRTGDGTGSITSSPDGIACGVACSADFASGTSVTLTAQAAAGSTFSGWSGACTGTVPTCTVTMDDARTVSAGFSLASYPLTVELWGSGLGTVTGDGISCLLPFAAGCTASYPNTSPPATVTLTATPDATSAFVGWTGCTTVSGNVCTVSIDAAKKVTATFQQGALLTVTTSGAGRGTVTGGGITCTTGSTEGCKAMVPVTTPATSVTLTATPDAASIFTGWSGCTSVSGNVCTVSITAARTATATFQPNTWLLTAKTSGTGAGTVTGAGLSCASGSTAGCTAQVPNTTPATNVTLTATPDATSIFTGWIGCTSMSGNVCTVTMTGAKTATATFQPATWLLTAKTSGTGAGTVTGAGLSCASGSTAGCTVQVPNTTPATDVTLTATPDAASIFTGWTGCTSVSGTVCTVTMTGAKTATATFQPSTYALTVSATGLGAGGSVTGPGISCAIGSTSGCSAAVANGATVTLTATPDAGSFLKSWTGCSSVSGTTCTVTMTSARTVTAAFQPTTYALTVNASGTGASGTVTGPDIACTTGSTAGCSAAVANGATVTLTATPDASSLVKSWTGCTSVSGATCTVTMTSAKTVTATFQPTTYALTVKPTFSYGGAGTISGAGLECSDPAGCTTAVGNGSTVTLTATPAAGSLLKSWVGCTTVSGATCTVTMTAARTATATFQPTQFRLTVTPGGTGTGTVTGPGIACTTGSSDGCAADVDNGASVTLTATPGACATFTSWGGGCYGTASQCTVAMTLARNITATFAAGVCPVSASAP